MIPLILRTTEEVILLVPNGYREAALALGVSRWKTIVHIVMKTCVQGYHHGILLALARSGRRNRSAPFHCFRQSFWNHSLSQPSLRSRCRFLPMRSLPMTIGIAGLGRRARARHRLFCVNVLVRILTRGRGAPSFSIR
jgi:phosphate transport system permease protein